MFENKITWNGIEIEKKVMLFKFQMNNKVREKLKLEIVPIYK